MTDWARPMGPEPMGPGPSGPLWTICSICWRFSRFLHLLRNTRPFFDIFGHLRSFWLATLAMSSFFCGTMTFWGTFFYTLSVGPTLGLTWCTVNPQSRDYDVVLGRLVFGVWCLVFFVFFVWCLVFFVLFNCNFEIKWPNDVILNQCKIAGILVESVSTDRNLFSVIGVGANINNPNMPTLQAMDNHRDSMKTSAAISLAQVTGNTTSLSEAIITILIELKKQIFTINEEPLEMVDRFNQALMWRNKAILVTSPSGAILKGTCLGITPDGGLQLKTENQIEIIHSGSVQKLDSLE